ncbi:MAG: DUF6544 family protein [Betaproteobacteria bacterium]
MWWVAWWAAVAAIGAIGTIASLNSVRFGHRVAHEAQEMAASADGPARPVAPSQLSTLPAPVQRYLTKAVGERSRPIGRVRLRHAGRFRPSLAGSWLPIRGEQYFATSPPGFVWWGRVRIAPGVWIDARDRSVGGIGNMLVTIESTITIANSRGAELDEGALLRLLGEMVWFPTAFLDDRYVHWSAIDDRHARAALTVNGRTVEGEFEFGPDDLPAAFSARRYRDAGGGKSVLTPFVGRLIDFRRTDGVLVPYRVVGAWVVDGKTIEYADFEVQRLELDGHGPWPRR